MTSRSDSLPEETLSRDGWLRRYRERFVEVAGFTAAQADDVTKAICTGPQDDNGFTELSEGWENDPEGAADEEMSYWDDDGD